jgi:hypothetical protein
MPKFNYASFGWRDMRDARRGRPKHDLRRYAAARGLSYLDNRPPRGFAGVLPEREGQLFNVLAGRLLGGETGIVCHERLRVPARGGKPPQGGCWWGVKYSPPGGLRPDLGELLDPLDLTHRLVDALDPTDLLMTDLSDLLGGGRAEPEDDAFLVPCTVAAARVPGIASELPPMRIDRRWRVPPHGFEHRVALSSVGLGGWHLQTAPDPLEQSVLERIDGSLRELLERSRKGFFQLIVAEGAVVVRRNGFLRSDEALDRHIGALATVANAAQRLAEVPR